MTLQFSTDDPVRPQSFEELMDSDSKFASFDPNNLTPEQPLWATYTYGDKMETFSGRGPAILSFNRENQAKMYFFSDGKWNLAAVKTNLPKVKCDRCGKHIQASDKANNRYGYGDWSSCYQFVRQGKKIATPLKMEFLCAVCR